MKIIVVGGGAAGLMAAGIAAKNGHNVKLIEKNKMLGRKLLITGKGRCNVTNACDISEFFDYVVDNKNFLYSAFYSFTNEDVMNFFKEMGVPLKVERGNRVFPVSDRSSDIVFALRNFINKYNVEIIKDELKDILIEDGSLAGVSLKTRGNLYASKVILATGGISYPITGSTGEGLMIAEKLGHKIISTQAALVPLVTKEDFVSKLQGLSLRNVKITLKDKNKEIYSDFGEMLFTHYGISGPTVLSASCFLEENKEYDFYIDLKPALDYNKLEERILRDFIKYQNKDFCNGLNDLLPSKLIPVIVELSQIDPTKKINQITKEERKQLVELLKQFKLTVVGKGSLDEAIITKGGVCLKEINPSNMESKIVEGLYFAGEMIDTFALTGGFNLQIAFSTGYLSGNSI